MFKLLVTLYLWSGHCVQLLLIFWPKSYNILIKSCWFSECSSTKQQTDCWDDKKVLDRRRKMNFYNQAHDSKKLMFVLYVTLIAKILRVVYNECIDKCTFFCVSWTDVLTLQPALQNISWLYIHALSTSCASCCRLPSLEMCVASWTMCTATKQLHHATHTWFFYSKIHISSWFSLVIHWA